MDPLSAGLQALNILKGGAGAQSPTVSSSTAGSFSGQTLVFGAPSIPSWNGANGGTGPDISTAFNGRPDSFVMGLTGLNTTTGYAGGSGISVANQPSGVMGSSVAMLGLVAAVAVVATLLIKG